MFMKGFESVFMTDLKELYIKVFLWKIARKVKLSGKTGIHISHDNQNYEECMKADTLSYENGSIVISECIWF